LSVLEYFVSTHGARKGLADTALKTANSGYLTRRLVDVSQDCIVTDVDCGTLDGIWVESLREAGEVIQPVSERILGRTALEDIADPYTEEVLVRANDEIDEVAIVKIDEAGIDRVQIRSLLTCRTKRGICVKCYGRDLAHGHPIEIGEAVGIIAAQSIGEPGTQLTMRTFHIGGTASRRVEQTQIVARNKGAIKFLDLHTVELTASAGSQASAGKHVVMSRKGEVAIMSAQGRERERYQIIYGAHLLVREGQRVEPGQVLAEWDPFTTPILTEVSGRVRFADIEEGKTMIEKVDPMTGMSSKVITEYKEIGETRPRISIIDAAGRVKKTSQGSPARYPLPLNAIIMVQDKDELPAGTILAKIPRETTKTKDITGGLPRVAELFEVRKPKEHAIISEIDGVVSYGKQTKGRRKVVITPDVGDAKEYIIPRGKHITVHEGDYIRAGEPLMDGSANPHDILAIRGLKELAKYLVDEIQEVYRLQGVQINDKHIEVIVRQMLRKINVTDPGDTDFLVGEHVERYRFEEVNELMLAQKQKPAVGEPLLLGITKASLTTESFISAASFQETTKVLTEAAISGKVDRLQGLKENVIMGRLIPAGTGLGKYRRMDEPPEAEAAAS
jgi:DNA-directed RNA polymerase subunit beta'